MTSYERLRYYRRQTGSKYPTPRQYRRLMKKACKTGDYEY